MTNLKDDEIPTVEIKNHEWAARRTMSAGYDQEDNTRRAEKLDESKAALWTPAAAAELEAIEKAERNGHPLSLSLRLRAGLLEDAKNAHERNAAAVTPERLRDMVAAEKGVPAGVLRGTTKEELEAHADAIKPLLTPAKSGAPTPYEAPAEPRDALRAAYPANETK